MSVVRSALLMAATAVLVGATVTAQDPCPTPAPLSGSGLTLSNLTFSDKTCFATYKNDVGKNVSGNKVDYSLTVQNATPEDAFLWILTRSNGEYPGQPVVIETTFGQAIYYRLDGTSSAVGSAAVPTGTTTSLTWSTVFEVTDTPYWDVEVYLGSAATGDQTTDMSGLATAPFGRFRGNTPSSGICY